MEALMYALDNVLAALDEVLVKGRVEDCGGCCGGHVWGIGSYEKSEVGFV